MYERASELQYAVEHNRTDAIDTGQAELNAVAQTATSADTDGLEKAQAVLEAVQSQAPDDAQEGLDTALSSVQDAMDRVPELPSEANNETSGDEGGLAGGLPI